jgi:integrase
MDRNPADFATRPRSARDDRDPPTPQDAVRLLKAAETYRPDLALWLLLVTGTRRGELCAIRWSDIDFAEQDLLIERAYAIRGGRKVIKPTKTHQHRRLALDPGTVELLAEYRELCGKRAAQVGGMLAADGYVFSSDGFGEQPRPPDTVTHWFKRVQLLAGRARVVRLVATVRKERSVAWRTGRDRWTGVRAIRRAAFSGGSAG